MSKEMDLLKFLDTTFREKYGLFIELFNTDKSFTIKIDPDTIGEQVCHLCNFLDILFNYYKTNNIKSTISKLYNDTHDYYIDYNKITYLKITSEGLFAYLSLNEILKEN